MVLKPYLSIDIETTGLDLTKAQVLQVAAVYDDGSSRMENLKTFSCIVDNGALTYGEPYALQLNGWIFKEIADGSARVHSIEEARHLFSLFLDSISLDPRTITVAGKNAAGFDIPILRANGFDMSRFKHRVIDPGSIYLNQFGYVPSINEINERLGRKPVTHDALDDCFDVVAQIRAAMR